MRQPAKKEIDRIIDDMAFRYGITKIQAIVVFNSFGYRYFTWCKKDDDVIIFANSEDEKQIKRFQITISQYAKCSQVMLLPKSLKYAFWVYPDL